MNWQKVAATDRRLRAEADNASEALAKHRYDNTIGAGVSFAEYARQCEVSERAVRSYAKAYEIRTSGSDLSISDALVRSSTSQERFDVIEAFAKVRGLSAKNVQVQHSAEVARIQQAATIRAEENGTTVREEARTLLGIGQRMAKAEQNRADKRRAEVDLQWLELDGHLGKARRALAAAMSVDVELTDEYRELLHETLKIVRGLIKLIEERFVGMSDRDFDAELADLLSKGS